ncbi:MAG TPA: ATP-binding cassette domain-containing protein [Labilithrix sp.]|nr:ATP-binding cassette domain-containing protein [Labilithrix sp.]
MTSRSLYARAGRTVLLEPQLGFAIVVGSLMHAAGHASLAAAGGVLARSLAGGAGPMDGRSIHVLQTLGGGDPLLGLAIAGVIAASAKLIGGVVAGWGEARVAGEVGAALRLEVLDAVLAVNKVHGARQRDHGEPRGTAAGAAGAHVALPSGRIADLASLTTHIVDVEKGISQGVFAEMRALLQIAPLVVLLAYLAPRLAGSAALALGGFSVLVMVARRALRRNHARAARQAEALLGAADEAVRHADLWATYGAEGRIRAHVRALGRTLIRTAARLRTRSALLSGTSEVLGALALALTLALVSAGAIGGVDRGAIVPFAIAFFMAYKPLRELVEGRLARGRAEEALAESARETSGETGDRGPGTNDRQPGREWGLLGLAVRGLRTRHGAHAPVSFTVAPGKIAALVGPTGIGKTSLLRALLGLDAPLAGTVTFGDDDLTAQGVGPGQRPFAWVPQDAPILADTLVANVLLGGAEHDVAAVGRVLDELGASALAASVGDATLATDRPVSGGERQWIAVARALASRLPVLLLDEPTASLDAAAQERMLRAIADLRGKRTVVIVTHRPEPLAIADLVVRLERLEHGEEEAA